MLEIQIIGNLGQDATIKNIGGKQFLSFSIGESRAYTDKEGNKHENTTWVSCLKQVYNGNTNLVQYLTKGTRVFARGRVSAKVFTRQDGTTVAALDCSVSELQLLGSPSREGFSQAAQPYPPFGTAAPRYENDLPF